MILAGDIGGTKTNLGFFRVEGKKLTSVVEQKYPSRDHAGLAEIVLDFLKNHCPGEDVMVGCFGIAGPVRNGRCEATNLPWVIDAKELASKTEVPTAILINDLEANAYGIACLDDKQLATLHAGAPDANGNAAIIAAGTGLGEAGLYWDTHTHRPFACEGGHCDFAPLDDLQAELWHYLRGRWEHVAYERVLSGPGLVNLYEFLRDTKRGEEPKWLADEMRTEDPAAAISIAALEGKSPLAAAALDLFVKIYGAEAGNLALKVMSTGGLYLGGGIAPKILSKLEEGSFIENFLAKGRMHDLLAAMPVRVILEPKTALLGAARCGALAAQLV